MGIKRELPPQALLEGKGRRWWSSANDCHTNGSTFKCEQWSWLLLLSWYLCLIFKLQMIFIPWYFLHFCWGQSAWPQALYYRICSYLPILSLYIVSSLTYLQVPPKCIFPFLSPLSCKCCLWGYLTERLFPNTTCSLTGLWEPDYGWLPWGWCLHRVDAQRLPTEERKMLPLSFQSKTNLAHLFH